jgi:hypothetical protein
VVLVTSFNIGIEPPQENHDELHYVFTFAGCSNARASVISKNMQKQTFMQKTNFHAKNNPG